MSTHVTGFRSFYFSGFLHHFVLTKLADSSIRVKWSSRQKNQCPKLPRLVYSPVIAAPVYVAWVPPLQDVLVQTFCNGGTRATVFIFGHYHIWSTKFDYNRSINNVFYQFSDQENWDDSKHYRLYGHYHNITYFSKQSSTSVNDQGGCL